MVVFFFNRKERKELVSFENAEFAKLCGNIFLFQYFMFSIVCCFCQAEPFVPQDKLRRSPAKYAHKVNPQRLSFRRKEKSSQVTPQR